jgi:hypothetical protein
MKQAASKRTTQRYIPQDTNNSSQPPLWEPQTLHIVIQEWEQPYSGRRTGGNKSPDLSAKLYTGHCFALAQLHVHGNVTCLCSKTDNGKPLSQLRIPYLGRASKTSVAAFHISVATATRRQKRVPIWTASPPLWTFSSTSYSSGWNSVNLFHMFTDITQTFLPS